MRDTDNSKNTKHIGGKGAFATTAAGRPQQMRAEDHSDLKDTGQRHFFT